MSARVLSINITSIVHQGEWTGSEGRTGIDKRSVEGPIEFKNNGVAGDRIIDTNVHGGYDQAVYAYATEDVRWWEKEIGEEISAGRFGENLTTEGIDVNAALVGEQWKIGSVIVEADNRVIGMAIWFLNFSTWQGVHGIYLEDLYIEPAYRGRGYGLALLKHLAKICVERGYGRFQWWVLDWNTPSIEFYKSQGAIAMDEWTVFRVSGEDLNKLGS